jgi:hypothetical protein
MSHLAQVLSIQQNELQMTFIGSEERLERHSCEKSTEESSARKKKFIASILTTYKK